MDQAQDWRRLCIRNVHAGRSHRFDTAIIPPSIFLKRSYGNMKVGNVLTVLDSQRKFFVPSCCVAHFSVREKVASGCSNLKCGLLEVI